MLTRTAPDDIVFLLDVDNTLFDNDHFSADLDARLDRDFGVEQRQRYRAIYGGLRDRLGYADYLGALQEFRNGLENDPAVALMSCFMLDYPFAERLYPRTLDAVAHLRTLGRPVILSDGDIVFQPHKIERSGLWQALHGDVLIYRHKERMLDAMRQRYPARHYVMVDDKPRLLAAMKTLLGARLTTVFVEQGHYAQDDADIRPPPDLRIARIDGLLSLDAHAFAGASTLDSLESLQKKEAS